jgi:hypothetical protein
MPCLSHLGRPALKGSTNDMMFIPDFMNAKCSADAEVISEILTDMQQAMILNCQTFFLTSLSIYNLSYTVGIQ